MAKIEVEHVTKVVNEVNRGDIMEENRNLIQTEDSPKVEVIEVEDRNPATEITPIQAFMSTNLNNRIKDYNDLSDRILHFFGYPAVAVPDLHRDQIFDAISIACEMFTKYAGYTHEYLVFDSNIYERDKGVRIDHLYTISSIKANEDMKSASIAQKRGPDQLLHTDEDVYVTKVPIMRDEYYISDEDYEKIKDKCSEADKKLLEYIHDFSKKYPNGLEELSIISGIMYDYFILRRNFKQEDFKKSKDKVFTMGGERQTIYYEDEDLGHKKDTLYFQKTYDYDLMDYRRVISVNDYVEGSSTTMTSLFSFEAALATTTYFTYQFSLRGFDLTSFTAMHFWRKERERILASKRKWYFDKNTQYLTLSPQPQHNQRFFGILSCYVEKPLRDIIHEQWVFQYALALCKIMLGRVRSKWGDSVAIVGSSGSWTGNQVANEGAQEKKDLETMLIEKRGFGDAPPPRFFVG